MHEPELQPGTYHTTFIQTYMISFKFNISK